MGYYIRTETVSIFIPKEKYDAAYKALCELNSRNDLKRGGRYPSEYNNSDGPNPHIWFSWMDWNYPETCKNLIEVLDQIGFTATEDEHGIIDLEYDSKTGNEEWFLCALAPFVQHGSQIHFIGEDDLEWNYLFSHGKLFVHYYSDKTEIPNYKEVSIPEPKLIGS